MTLRSQDIVSSSQHNELSAPHSKQDGTHQQHRVIANFGQVNIDVNSQPEIG